MFTTLYDGGVDVRVGAALRIAAPALVFLSTLAVIPLKPTHTAEASDVTVVVAATRTPRRSAILSLLTLSALTYLLDGVLFVINVVITGRWEEMTGYDVAAVLGLVAFAGLAALGAYKDVIGVAVWETRRVRFGISGALLLEIASVVLLAIEFSHTRLPQIPTYDFVHGAFAAGRVLILIPLVVALAHPRVTYTSVLSDETATTSTSLLLPAGVAAEASTGLSPLAAKDGSAYGTFNSRTGRAADVAASGPTTRAPTPTPSTKGAPKEEIALDPSWSEIRQRLRRITPYLWPSKSRALQFLAVACFGLLVLGRIVNVLQPFALAKLVESFEHPAGMPWLYLLGYAGLRYLQSSGGLAALRDILWTPVMQYSDRSMSQLCFDHLLNLSLAFHTRRKTGEVLRILDRGAAINRIFEMLLFNFFPIIADITIALVVFVTYFEWTLGLIIFFDMAAYMAASVILTRWRTKLRRQMNDRDVITRGIHTDCLLNYETVKYFNGERHEGERYADAIRQYQAIEYRVITSLNLLNLVQNLIMALGLLVGSMIVALRVTRGQSQAHDFVLFITYIAQLYGPLAMLGSLYRSVNQGLVDTERLLKLLNEPTEVNDLPDAQPLVVKDGTIEFDNVSFSYDGRSTALSGVSFTVPKGASVALVGESGAGKSTILRLLYRFYDLQPGQGAIRIDGQDIRDVTQDSLRQAIGVVPQDSVLFNASIRYNIGYGRFGASDSEIETAARAAQMHERILTFPDGYETKVGERGVRLSGGEKQRVAIARTLLKDPPVLLLDEATSALDTSTERDIQKALVNLVRGRSSLWIAHRLSTIASADLILVLKDGAVAEQGTHAELLAKGGLFAAMWADQVSSGSDHGDDAAGDGDGDVKEPVVPTAEETVGYFVEDPQAVSEPAAPAPEDPTVEAESTIPPSVSETQEAPAIVDSPSVLTEQTHAEAAPAPAAEESDAPVPVAFPSSDEPEDKPAPVAFPTSQSEAELPQAADPAPIAFPTSDDAASTRSPAPAPVAFPASDDASTAPTAPEREDVASPASEAISTTSPAQSPTPAGVTFSPEANPSRDGTPDPAAEPKRRRISSQNFQRLARRISISGKRQNSANAIANLIPGLKRAEGREASEASVASGSSTPASGAAGQTESPAGSVRASEDTTASPGKLTKDKKKEKKEKRKTLL